MIVSGAPRFPVVDTPEIRTLRRELGHKVRGMGYDPDRDFVLLWHPPTRRYCVTLITSHERREFWVITSYARGRFTRDDFDMVWFNLDRKRRTEATQAWAAEQVSKETDAVREADDAHRESVDRRKWAAKNLLKPSADPNDLRALY